MSQSYSKDGKHLLNVFTSEEELDTPTFQSGVYREHLLLAGMRAVCLSHYPLVLTAYFILDDEDLKLFSFLNEGNSLVIMLKF